MTVSVILYVFDLLGGYVLIHRSIDQLEVFLVIVDELYLIGALTTVICRAMILKAY